MPNDWQTADNSPYVDENDIDLLNWDVFTDDSGRKFVTDEKSGQRFFIVNSEKVKQSGFKEKWNAVLQASGSGKKSTVRFNPNDRQFPGSDDDISDESIKNLEHEPSNLRLRNTAKFSPDRIINPNSRANSDKLFNTLNAIRIPDEDSNRVLRQEGKMSHLMPKPDPDSNESNNNNNKGDFFNNKYFFRHS